MFNLEKNDTKIERPDDEYTYTKTPLYGMSDKSPCLDPIYAPIPSYNLNLLKRTKSTKLQMQRNFSTSSIS